MEQPALAGAVRWVQANDIRAQGVGWSTWLDGQNAGPQKDPQRHPAQVLRQFLEAVRPGLPKEVLAAVQGEEEAMQSLATFLGSKGAGLVKLMELTRTHPNFRAFYGCLGLFPDETWVQRKRRKLKGEPPENVEDILLAVDCEMVATDQDQNALARVCACNAKGEVLMDRLVRPEGVITDARSDITGLQAAQLAEVDFSLSDAQEELLGLMSPWTVLVGHTLNHDLSVLRLQSFLVLDIGLLYAIEGQPRRRPALAHLVHQLLRKDFRLEGLHDCVQDVLMTMQIAVQRLRGGAVGTVWVPAPPASDKDLANARTLYVHRVPQRQDAFAAIAKLFASLPAEFGSSLEGINMLQSGNAALISATARFASAEAAEAAFLAIPAESIEIDKVQRPQKLVKIHFEDRSALICIRPILGGIGKASLAKPEPKAPVVKPKRTGKGWPGWRRAAEQLLAAQPSKALHWQQLIEELVLQRREQAGGRPGEQSEPQELLQLRALAHLPEEFLSETEPLVRLR
ncbi:unnamed protein product [Effrenium voratum]|uniref:Exonuclease domain-containing protein n=1 Tax=Effrenium voratum TaxID=2562239 RepID=A0AA36N9K3_9DINO|nr:unnamed protein product [Effrenium voratum]